MKMDSFTSVICWFLACTLSVSLLVGAGCSTTKKSENLSEETDEKKTEISGPAPIYYDFEDVLIPAELSLDKKKSFVYTSHTFTAGVLAFDGKVTGDSLVGFFSNSMPKDGWVLKSSFRYGRVILNFEKEERSCLISIEESTFTTKVEVWVSPQLTADTSY